MDWEIVYTSLESNLGRSKSRFGAVRSLTLSEVVKVRKSKGALTEVAGGRGGEPEGAFQVELTVNPDWLRKQIHSQKMNRDLGKLYFSWTRKPGPKRTRLSVPRPVSALTEKCEECRTDSLWPHCFSLDFESPLCSPSALLHGKWVRQIKHSLGRTLSGAKDTLMWTLGSC